MGSNISAPYVAFHVIRVDANSPSGIAGLDPYFDYIVSVEDQTILRETPNVVAQMSKLNIGNPITLKVYNSRFESYRQVSIVPSITWGGEGLLGCSIRFCSYEEASSRVWHVLDIVSGSPADMSGLIDHRDYIIGTPHSLLVNNDDLTDLLEKMDKQHTKLIVYNIDMERCREVVVIPDKDWGGTGSLGCHIGFGYLHKIPRSVRTDSIPKSIIMDEPNSKPLNNTVIVESPATDSSKKNIASSLLYLTHDLSAHDQSGSDIESIQSTKSNPSMLNNIPGVPPSPPSPLNDKDKIPSNVKTDVSIPGITITKHHSQADLSIDLSPKSTQDICITSDDHGSPYNDNHHIISLSQ